jgi:hypothetical protein
MTIARNDRVSARYLSLAIAAIASGFCCHIAHGAPSDACAIVTAADVAAAVGFQVENGVRQSTKYADSCSWQETGAGILKRSAHLMILDAHKFEVGKTPFGGIKKEPQSGLGDDAYSVTLDREFDINVKKGSTYVKVWVLGNQSKSDDVAEVLQKNTAATRQLVQAVIRKL